MIHVHLDSLLMAGLVTVQGLATLIGVYAACKLFGSLVNP